MPLTSSMDSALMAQRFIGLEFRSLYFILHIQATARRVKKHQRNVASGQIRPLTRALLSKQISASKGRFCSV